MQRASEAVATSIIVYIQILGQFELPNTAELLRMATKSSDLGTVPAPTAGTQGNTSNIPGPLAVDEEVRATLYLGALGPRQ
jgi:hypothetical protein